MDNLSEIIASNIVELRKRNKLTQAELAEKLNYSDKAISKWERAEAVPEVIVLKQIANIFNVTLDYMVTMPSANKAHLTKKFSLSKSIITWLSVILVWFIATIVFVCLEIGHFDRAYLAFIVGIPFALLVAFILSAVWKQKIKVFVLLSAFIWATIACIYIIINNVKFVPLFLIGIPLQVAVLLWFVLVKFYEHRRKIKVNN